MFLIHPIRNFYSRFERPISSLSLIGGFVFDALTLKRVDALWENLWILGHLLIVGIFIILIHLQENEAGDEKNSKKIHFWYVNILQFFFGGLLSTYLVFYFRSADIFTTWPFIAILIGAFIANESFKRHYIRLSFQISLFFLSVYSFAIFLVPVVLHKIGTFVFLLSGLLSLVFIIVFLFILLKLLNTNFFSVRNFLSLKIPEVGSPSLAKPLQKVVFRNLLFIIFGIFILINFLYFTNLIPPIPLSLKDAGVYHSIQKNIEGNYNVTFEDYGWKGYFNLYKNFSQVSGEPIYAFSAIFSPKNLNLTIIHEWQYYDEIQKKWVIDRNISLPVIGGRDGGFRTYSMRYGLATGKWRVNVKTEQGQTIGVLRFKIIQTNTEPTLTAGVK